MALLDDLKGKSGGIRLQVGMAFKSSSWRRSPGWSLG